MTQITFQPQVAEVLRFVIGGITSTIVCWGSFLVLLHVFGLHYLVCTNAATLITWGYAYLINKYLVFRNHRKAHAIQGSKYLMLQASLLVLSNSLMFLQIDVWGWSIHLSLFLMTVLVTVLNFAALKLIVFAEMPAKPPVVQPSVPGQEAAS